MVVETADGHSGAMTEHTLNPLNIKRLERTDSGDIVAGVAAGLGRYFDLTPAVFRLGFVVLTLLGGAGVLVYIAAVLVMPKEGEERSIAEEILVKRREHPGRLVALGLVAVAILSLLARTSTWPSTGAAWFLIVVAGLVFLWTSRRRGIAVALAAVLTLVLVAAVSAVIAAFAWFDVSLDDGVGKKTYTPAVVASDYKLGIGDLRLDLTRVTSTAPTLVHARVGIGELKIVVPRGAAVSVDAKVKVGNADILGRHDDGTHVHVRTAQGGRFDVVAKVGAGHIEVVRSR